MVRRPSVVPPLFLNNTLQREVLKTTDLPPDSFFQKTIISGTLEYIRHLGQFHRSTGWQVAYLGMSSQQSKTVLFSRTQMFHCTGCGRSSAKVLLIAWSCVCSWLHSAAWGAAFAQSWFLCSWQPSRHRPISASRHWTESRQSSGSVTRRLSCSSP